MYLNGVGAYLRVAIKQLFFGPSQVQDILVKYLVICLMEVV